MNISYRSTRSKDIRVRASQAILQGLAPDGGLYVPEVMPRLGLGLGELATMSYQDCAFEVLRLFLGDYTADEIREAVAAAYGGQTKAGFVQSKFTAANVAPLRAVGGVYYLELFHGPTLAFKDMALSILPHLLRQAAEKNQVKEEIVILCATSGDTGKAALAGFADVAGVRVIVFYPKDGVSKIQERQMVTQAGGNVHVVGIKGNFDDAQTGVKRIFNDAEMGAALKERGFVLSSANSINIGRVIPQIAYYVYAYGRLLAAGVINEGEKVNVAVPTGNFGNILAAFYAKQIGLPIGRLICASNENKVLHDFFSSGAYDKNRALIPTSSPSMDILISSNLERLIFHAAGGDDEKCRDLMAALGRGGYYEITDDMRAGLGDFYGGFATEEETRAAIGALYRQTGYVIDPHTAVAWHVQERYHEAAGDETKCVIAATASPFKFPEAVLAALADEAVEPSESDAIDQYGQCVSASGYADSELALIDRLSQLAALAVPKAITELKDAPIRHDSVCGVDEMAAVVLDWLSS